MTKKFPFRKIPQGVLIFTLFVVACSKSPSKYSTNPSTLNSSAHNVMASTIGVGTSPNNFNLNDVRDLIVPFDYYSSGFAKQLVCYRPGASTVWMFNNTAAVGAAPVFVPVYTSSGGIGTGSNNYNMTDNRDRIIPYDLDGTGKLDHLICYRPGTGAFWIFKHQLNPEIWTPVTRSSIGVGASPNNYDLSDSRDLIIPFDYYGTGKASQLLCYRPGASICWVLNNTAPVGNTPAFVPVFMLSAGIGIPPNNYDLSDNRDLIFSYDDGAVGKLDHIVCYRPGMGTVFLFSHNIANGFQPISGGISRLGIISNGGTYPSAVFDLASSLDRIIPYDYFSNGQNNGVVAYRPGSRVCYMFAPFHTEGACQFKSSSGVGGFDLSNTNDKIIAYDLNGKGKLDHLVVYRPGSGAFWILSNALTKIY